MSSGDVAVSSSDEQKGKGKTFRRAPTPEQISVPKRVKAAAAVTVAAAALPGAQGFPLSPRLHSHMGWDAMEMTLLLVLAFVLGMVLRDFVIKVVVKYAAPGHRGGELRSLKKSAGKYDDADWQRTHQQCSGSSKEDFMPVPENEIVVSKTGRKFHKIDSCSLKSSAPRHSRYERCLRCWPLQQKTANISGSE